MANSRVRHFRADDITEAKLQRIVAYLQGIGIAKATESAAVKWALGQVKIPGENGTTKTPKNTGGKQ